MTKSKLVSFSPTGEKLAHSGPNGILRIWDTTSGILEHEYQPAEHLKATTSCIKYSPKVGKNKEGHSLIAMGTLAGTILLYSPEESEVKSILEHSSHQAVVDLAWFSSERLVSLARDNTIFIWDITTGQKELLDMTCDGSAICLFGKKTIALGNRRIQVMMRQDSGKIKMKNNFLGHGSTVNQLLKIKMKEKSDDNYFLSSSVDDRFIYAWSTGASGETPVCSFMVKDTVTNMAAGKMSKNTLAISTVTQKGSLVLFRHHLNGNTSKKPIKSTGTLQIYSQSGSKKSVIPIVASYFCNDSDDSIIVVYNRSSIFTFERLRLDTIVGTQELIREEPKSTHKISLTKTITPRITDDATMVGPMQLPSQKAQLPPQKQTLTKSKRKRGDEDNVASLPMEERLNVLALDTSSAQSKLPGADDFAQLLLQGLHSKDQDIIRGVFDRGDLKSIHNTVRRLPIPAIVPLLEQLSIAIVGKGHKDANHIKWLRAVIYTHMSHLMTIPNRMQLLQPFFNISEARMSTFSQVTQLHARLDLMLTHVAARQKEVKQNDVQPEALLVYRDESSDEEDMMDNILGISESEDNWDELSDLDMPNGQTDEDSDMDIEQRVESVKRKMSNDDSILTNNGNDDESDSDDQEDDDDGGGDDENDDDDNEAELGDDIEDSEDYTKMNGDDDGGTDSDSS